MWFLLRARQEQDNGFGGRIPVLPCANRNHPANAFEPGGQVFLFVLSSSWPAQFWVATRQFFQQLLQPFCLQTLIYFGYQGILYSKIVESDSRIDFTLLES